jgi:hypothetical protein
LLRQTPILVLTYSRLELRGLITMSFTKKKSAPLVEASCDQVAPPSEDLKIPAPRTPSALKYRFDSHPAVLPSAVAGGGSPHPVWEA